MTEGRQTGREPRGAGKGREGRVSEVGGAERRGTAEPGLFAGARARACGWKWPARAGADVCPEACALPQ